MLEDVYLKSVAGQDLAAANLWGYRVPRTGKFYISERYSEYLISKNPDGTWRVTSTAKSKQVLGDFVTPEDCFRKIWAWLVIQRGKLPLGKTTKEFSAWLLDSACPAWGKQFNIDQIQEVYAESISKETGLVTDISGIFTGPEWEERFEIFGKYDSEDGAGIYLKRTKNSFELKFEMGMPKSPSFFKSMIEEAYRKEEIQNISWVVPTLEIHMSLKKQYKIASSSAVVSIKIGETSLNQIEQRSLETYLKYLRTHQVDNYAPGQNPFLLFTIEVMQGNIIQALRGAVQTYPVLVKDLPQKYADEVIKLEGWSEEEIKAIAMSANLGLI